MSAPPPELELPPLSATEAELSSWVGMVITALDDTPRRVNWRWRALGRRNLTEVLAEAPTHYNLRLQLPIGEQRIIADLARSRGLGLQPYARRLMGSALAAIEGLEYDDVPYLLKGGLLRPRDPDG